MTLTTEELQPATSLQGLCVLLFLWGRKMHRSILLIITKFGVAAQWEGLFSLDIYALNWVQLSKFQEPGPEEEQTVHVCCRHLPHQDRTSTHMTQSQY